MPHGYRSMFLSMMIGDKNSLFAGRSIGDFVLYAKQNIAVPPEIGLCLKCPGVKWVPEGGKSMEVETVPAGLIMRTGWHASGGEEIWVKDPLEPGVS